MHHLLTLAFATLTELQTAVEKLAGASQAPAPAKTKAEKTAAAPAPAAVAPSPEPAAAVSAPPPPVSAPATVSAPPTTDYPTLQKAVFKLAGLSREVVGAVAESFGVKTFKDLAPERWSEALAAVNAEIENLAVPA